MKSSQRTWANRIVGYDDVDPEQLCAHPKNFRIHPKFQQDALLGAIDEVGFIRSVTVNRRTGFVLDGHLRVALALRTGQTSIPVEYVDLSEAEEAEALATIDPIAALAAVDAEKLDDLLQEVQTGSEAVQALLSDLALDAERATLTDPGGGGSERTLGKQLVVKAVLVVEDVATFERALTATGLGNRGEALLAICRVYLGETDEEGQFDAGRQGLLAAPLALPAL